MILLDIDTLSLLLAGNGPVLSRLDTQTMGHPAEFPYPSRRSGSTR